jgi:hypothetical protein
MSAAIPEKLLIVWTSGEIDVARKMVFMYSKNALLNGWWDEVTLLVWGPSSNLLAGDAGLQESVNELKETGVKVIACKACAEQYGIVPRLEALGVKVFYAGEFLTQWIKSGDKYISF